MTYTYPTRALNTAFQISTGFDTYATYSVDVACTLNLTGGMSGTVFFELADDEAFTTNVQEVCRFTNGNTGTLTIGLAITQTSTAQLSGMVENNKWTRLRTANNTGSPTFTFRSAQEALGV